MSTIKNRLVDPVLTQLSRGFKNPSFIGTKLFPVVMVAKEGGKIPQFSKDAFKIYNTERALRANSNIISPEGKTTIDFALTEHDLSYPMDYREVEEDITPLKIHATNVTTDGIALRLEKLIADMSQDLNTYPTGNKVTLGAGSKFDDNTSDPFAIFDTAKEAVRGKIAKRPNVCILGATAYKSLKNHAAIVDRIQYTQNAVITAELLRQLLDFEQLYVGDSVYSDDAGAFVDIWADNVIVAYVPSKESDVERSYYEPAFAYTLRKNGNPVIDLYDSDGKVQYVRNTDIFIPKVVGSEAGYLIKSTNT